MSPLLLNPVSTISGEHHALKTELILFRQNFVRLLRAAQRTKVRGDMVGEPIFP